MPGIAIKLDIKKDAFFINIRYLVILHPQLIFYLGLANNDVRTKI